MTNHPPSGPQPPIEDYAFLGDCHSAALVSRGGSVDWCCMPRMDGESCFGRLLDWERGGFCAVRPVGEGFEIERRYLDTTLMLETRFVREDAELRLLDGFVMRPGPEQRPDSQLVRIVEAVRGPVEVEFDIRARFDYGWLEPWVRHHQGCLFSALGGDLGLLVSGDVGFELCDGADLRARVHLEPGQRRRLSLQALPSRRLYPTEPEGASVAEIDRRFDDSVAWWKEWVAAGDCEYRDAAALIRSACVLKALTYAPTGAIAAAATTSLPETIGGERNWDYRYSWIRDSVFALQALSGIGFVDEAQGFRHFIERTAAGDASQLSVLFGIDGRTRIVEYELEHLAGYRGSRPVRVGNRAYRQVQLDIFGYLLDLAWKSTRIGDPPDASYWRFLHQVVEHVAERWQEPDRGIWEVRKEPEHFVYSKAMCWAAVDRGLRLGEHLGFEMPVDRWRALRGEIRRAIEEQGYDPARGVFVRAFGSSGMDATLLLLPRLGFVAYDDERFERTLRAVREELETETGLLLRYRAPDGLSGGEGCFVACSFWLAECLAIQGRKDEAQEVFDRASRCANDLGLFAEEYDPDERTQLGNFPQGLSHYAQIAAGMAIAGFPTPGDDPRP
jgi:GH15 family glucan-1,4-alpha-glucosidase